MGEKEAEKTGREAAVEWGRKRLRRREGKHPDRMCLDNYKNTKMKKP
jgi:hypothetical protein